MKIKYRLLITHGILIVLVLVVIIVNIFTYSNMQSDTEYINDFGKLRANTFNLAHKTALMEHAVSNDEKIQLSNKMNFLIDLYEERVHKLLGENLGSQALQDELAGIDVNWETTYKPIYQRVADGLATPEDYNMIETSVDAFVVKINALISDYNTYTRNKIFYALLANGILISSLVVVALYSLVKSNKWINKPLTDLTQEMKKLTLYDENLSESISRAHMDEIGAMGKYFNIMALDQLTQTFSRRPGLSKLESLIKAMSEKKAKGVPPVISLCYIDINGLKEVNDSLGHEMGDQFILDTVNCVKDAIRQSDFIIRMGGDEFLIVFTGIDKDKTESVWQRISGCYSIINESGDKPYTLSASHGIVSYTAGDELELTELIKEADRLMYEEKERYKRSLKAKDH